MTITATIVSDDLQASGNHNVLCRYDDDVDGSSIERLHKVPPGDAAFVQAWVDARAVELEEDKRQLELSTNFETVRNGGHSENDVTLLYNTTAQWEEHLFKGMSNLLWGPGVADFAHVWTESKANNRARVATGLSTPQVVGWSGDAQPVGQGRTNYETGHPNQNEGDLYNFPGFPTE